MGIAASLVNQTTSSGAVAAYSLLTTLISGGWSAVSSGDGLSAYNGSGNVFTSGNSGANGFDNTNAWIVLQQPGGGTAPYTGTRQLRITRAANASQIYMAHSFSVGFTGGAAATLPTASDQKGFNTAHSGDTWTGNGRYHIIITNAAENFGWCLMAWDPGGGTTNVASWAMDPVTGYAAGDTDPFVYHNSVSGFDVAYWSSDTADQFGYLGVPPADHQGLQMAFHTTTSVNVTGGSRSVGQSNFTGNDIGVPFFYFRRSGLSTPNGWKGFSSLFRLLGAMRATADTFEVTVPLDYCAIKHGMFRWNETDTPTL